MSGESTTSGSTVQLYGNLVGLVSALVAFVVLVVSYVYFTKKELIRGDYLAGLMIVNGIILTFLVSFLVYVETRSIFAT